MVNPEEIIKFSMVITLLTFPTEELLLVDIFQISLRLNFFLSFFNGFGVSNYNFFLIADTVCMWSYSLTLIAMTLAICWSF